MEVMEVVKRRRRGWSSLGGRVGDGEEDSERRA